MVKFTMCLHRKPGMSPEAFHDYWLNRHGPLVRSLAGALNIRRYVQVHALDLPINASFRKSRGGPQGFDGIAELYYDSIESFEAPFATEAGRAAGRTLRADEATFIDLARSPGWVGEEKPILE